MSSVGRHPVWRFHSLDAESSGTVARRDFLWQLRPRAQRQARIAESVFPNALKPATFVPARIGDRLAQGPERYSRTPARGAGWSARTSVATSNLAQSHSEPGKPHSRASLQLHDRSQTDTKTDRAIAPW